MEITGNSQMEAVIFVGIQGSGKTSYFRDRFFDTHVRISLDMLRTRQRESVLVNACLAAKQPFVIDNTNVLARDRARYVPAARQSGFRVHAYLFETSLADAIRRNSQRSGKGRIPMPAIAGTLKKLEPPSLAEGFDAIYTVTISAEGKFIVTACAANTPRGR